MELVDVTVYYLEMHAPPGRVDLRMLREVPAPRDDLLVLRVGQPSPSYYRFLYDGVGRDYHWLSRRKLTDVELANILHDPLSEVHVLHVDGAPAGFAELDRRQEQEVELVQFGLLPEYHGQGLGTWFLTAVMELVWSYQPQRFWLHTCTLDHAAALGLYTKCGFALYDEQQIRREL